MVFPLTRLQQKNIVRVRSSGAAAFLAAGWTSSAARRSRPAESTSTPTSVGEAEDTPHFVFL